MKLSSGLSLAHSGNLGYIAEAQAWFQAVESLGGSYDLTSINPLYTESYTKKAWSDRLATLMETSGAWENATEVIPMIGVSWHNSGGFRKLKYDETETVVYTSDFSAGVDGWTANGGGTATGNIDAIGGRDDCLRLTVSTTVGSHLLQKTSILTSGRYYSITGEAYIPSSNDVVDGILFQSGDGSVSSGSSYESLAQDSWVDIEITGVTGSTTLTVRCKDGSSNTINDAGGDDVIYIRNVVVTELSPATVINNGFITGDYTPAGSGAGLTGDGSSYFDSGYWAENFSVDDLHMAANVSATSGVGRVMGARVTGTNDEISLQASGAMYLSAPKTSAQIGGFTEAESHWLISRRSNIDVEAYENGASVGTDTNAPTFTLPPTNVLVFAIYAGVVTDHSEYTLSLAHYGTGLTDAQAAAWSVFCNGIASDFA